MCCGVNLNATLAAAIKNVATFSTTWCRKQRQPTNNLVSCKLHYWAWWWEEAYTDEVEVKHEGIWRCYCRLMSRRCKAKRTEALIGWACEELALPEAPTKTRSCEGGREPEGIPHHGDTIVVLSISFYPILIHSEGLQHHAHNFRKTFLFWDSRNSH